MKSLRLGALAVMATLGLALSPSLHATELVWGTQERSVAAIMWKALKAAHDQDQAAEYPQNHIQQGRLGGYVVQDSEDYLKCNAAMIGSSIVPLYICRLSQIQYEWQERSSSIPAVLYEALQTLHEIEMQEGEPRLVQQTQPGAYIVTGEKRTLTCESDSFGLTPVQSYQCTLESHN